MFPQSSRRKPKFRVVTPKVNPSAPSLTYPNGTYLPPVSSATAAIGSQGQFGAMLPFVPSSPLLNVQAPKPLNQGVNTGMTFGPPAPLPVSSAASQPPAYGGYGVGGQSTTQVPSTGQIYRSAIGTVDPALRIQQQKLSNVQTDFERFGADFATTGVPNMNLLPAKLDIRTVTRLGLDAADMTELGYIRNPITMEWENPGKTQVQTQQGQVTTAAGTGSADFMGTGFMQQNAANNVEFENQLRWDPIKKKYRKIGQIQSDYGYLPNADAKNLNRKGGYKGNQASSQPVQQQQSNVSYTSTSGNFNTATG